MTTQIHDRGYQLLFSNPEIFRQLLESFVKQPWVSQLDFSRCEKLNKSFISKDYEKRESDLIYKVPWQECDAYIVILVEFQSTVQRFMAVRVWRYLAEFYTDWIETHHPLAHEKLPPIFPIVLYNGEETWTAPENLSALIENNELLGEFGLQFKYFKVIENEFTVEALLKIRNIVSTLFLAEVHYDEELLLEELLPLFRREKRHAISLFINWLKQLYLHGRLREQDYREFEAIYHNESEVSMFIKSLHQAREETFLQGVREGESKGKLEGKLEGKQEIQAEVVRAMLLEGFEISVIAKITRLRIEEIHRPVDH